MGQRQPDSRAERASDTDLGDPADAPLAGDAPLTEGHPGPLTPPVEPAGNEGPSGNDIPDTPTATPYGGAPLKPGQNASNTTVVFDLTIWQRHDVENKLRGTFGDLRGYTFTG